MVNYFVSFKIKEIADKYRKVETIYENTILNQITYKKLCFAIHTKEQRHSAAL